VQWNDSGNWKSVQHGDSKWSGIREHVGEVQTDDMSMGLLRTCNKWRTEIHVNQTNF